MTNNDTQDIAKVVPFQEYMPCPECKGKGYTSFQFIKRPCLSCRGKRKIIVMENDGRHAKRITKGGMKRRD